MGRFLLGHLRRCKRSVEWRDVSDVYLTKRPTQVIYETVGAGARKSVCFLDLLGWTVVSHERLRSQCTQFVCPQGTKSSALRRIALAAWSTECKDSVLTAAQRIGGEHFRQPVLSIVCQASMALCRSIRLRDCGIG